MKLLAPIVNDEDIVNKKYIGLSIYLIISNNEALVSNPTLISISEQTKLSIPKHIRYARYINGL